LWKSGFIFFGGCCGSDVYVCVHIKFGAFWGFQLRLSRRVSGKQWKRNKSVENYESIKLLYVVVKRTVKLEWNGMQPRSTRRSCRLYTYLLITPTHSFVVFIIEKCVLSR
jgi:hypothetical protein